MTKILKKGITIFFFLMISQILFATITYSPHNPKVGENINFSTTSACTGLIPIQPKWYFGESGSGFFLTPTGKNVSHKYGKPGTYTINVKCGNTIIDRLIITITDSQPVNRSVTFSPANPSPGNSVTFQAKNFSSDCIKWKFGDGTQPENGGHSKSHIFSKPGLFNVKVYSYCGDDPSPVIVHINVADHRELTAFPKSVGIGEHIKFIASNYISNCIKWDFGDGTSLTGNKNQDHVYRKQGSFTVKAYDHCGDDKFPKVITVKIRDERELTAQPLTSDIGVPVKFITKHFISNCIKWDFGDGTVINGNRTTEHIYKRQGTFTVKAFDNCNKNHSPKEVTIHIRDRRKVTYNSFNLKTGVNIMFKAENFQSNCIKWDFGDGAIIPNGEKSQSHSFKTAGTFMVKAYDDCGHDLSPKMVNITINNSINIIKIEKKILYSPKNPHAGEKILFKTLNFMSDCVNWSFGDGTKIIRSGKITSHSYAKAGFFKVKVYDKCNLLLKPVEITIPVKNSVSIKIITPRRTVPNLPPCPEKSEIDIEDITLEHPKPPTNIMDINDNTGTITHAPKIDDMTCFQWSEDNPGRAEFFELRIFDKYGKKLILKKKIPKMNYIYPVDADLINEIHKMAESNLRKLKISGKGNLKQRKGVNMRKQISTIPKGFPEDTDLCWEVAGLKRVLCQENKKSSFKDIEIGISQKWPLSLPDAYTGMNCPSEGSKRSNLRTDDIDRETFETGEFDPNIYVFHRLKLKGSFNLKDTPYATVPGIISQKNPGGWNNKIDQADFNNIFVDWGDGSPTQTLSGKPMEDIYYLYENKELRSDVEMSLKDGFIHQYSRAGKYTVRVFMLSEKDIQQPMENFNELLGRSINPQSQQNNPYTILHTNINSKFGFSAPKINFSDGMSGVKDRAYMLYCENIIVRDRMDLCADGPLNLVSVEITGFPGHDSTGNTTYIGDALNNPGVLPGSNNKNRVINRKGSSSSQTIPSLKKDKSKLKIGDLKYKKNNMTISPDLNQISYKTDAKAVTCDEMFQAKAELTFFGRIGSALITWKVDGIKVYSEIVSGLSSEYRSNLTKEDAADCSKALINSKTVYSSNLPVKNPGIHTISVSARVVPDMTSPYIGKVIGDTLINISRNRKKDAGTLYLQQMLNGTKTMKNQKVGFFPPNTNSLKYQNVSYVNSLKQSFLPTVKEFNLPPYFVISKIKKYSVSQVKPGKICSMVFPTSKGNFKITDINSSIHKTGNLYSGSGILKLPLTINSHSIKYYAIPIYFRNWSINESSGLVKNGTISLYPKIDVFTPATEATINYIKGTTSGPLNASLSLTVRDKSLLLPAGGNSGETPPKWTITNTLSGYDNPSSLEGDWIAKNKKLPETLISWTGFRISSENITIDFSRSEGEGSGICGGSAASWVGINLGIAQIIPYTFNLVSSSPFIVNSDKFTITDKGLCGSVSSSPFFSTLDKGSLKFNSVKLTAENGAYDIEYKDLDIFVPWIDSHLTGNAPLVKTSQGYGISMSGVKSPDIHKDYENISMTARNLAFITEKNIGWIVRSDTEFNFSSENRNFAKFTLNYFLFGFDGKAYFKEGGTNQSIQIGGESFLGDCTFTHNSVDITAPSGNNGDRIKFIFHPKLHLTESPLIHDPDVQINYGILNNSSSYFAKGPEILPFSLNLTYPLGNPLMQSTIKPEYSPSNSGLSKNIFLPDYNSTSILTVPGGESVNGQDGTRFYGSANMSMFGGPPVDSQFLLGYNGSGSFFLIRADFPLSSSGVPFIPPFLTLFRISGGLGYNFPVDSFKEPSIKDAVPDMNGKTIFMAGMRIGHPTKFPYMMDGILAITTGGEARMDFNAWLLSNNHSGQGNLTGFFKYGGGSFDGKMWGGYNFLNGLFSIDLGSSESNSAVDIHFGNGKWHIYAGNKNGQRIKAHFLIHDADSYIMLGSDVGLALGGSESIDLDKSVGDVMSGYVKGWMDIGVQVKPQPKIVGDFNAGVKAGACVNISGFEGCVSSGVNAKIHVDAPPLYMSAKVTLDLPWPAGDISFKVRL